MLLCYISYYYFTNFNFHFYCIQRLSQKYKYYMYTILLFRYKIFISLQKKCNWLVTRWHKRVTVNNTVVSSILNRRNELLLLLFHFFALVTRYNKVFNPLLNAQCLQNSAESGERNVLKLGSYYKRDVEWRLKKNITTD